MLYNQLFKCELNFWEKKLYFWTIFMRKITVRELQVHSVYVLSRIWLERQPVRTNRANVVRTSHYGRNPKTLSKNYDAHYHSNKRES